MPTSRATALHNSVPASDTANFVAVAADNRFAIASAKEQAEATLAHAFGQSMLDEDELDERMERLAHADTLAEVERLVIDLEVPPADSAKVSSLVPTESPNQALATLADAGEIDASRRMVAVLGEQKRSGDWTPARRNEVITVLGNSTLDLRNARLPPGETEINVRGLLSETNIIVPPGMSVTTECSTILAEVSQDENYTDAPTHPAKIRVTGIVVLGSIEIKVREEGESARQARRRRRRERKALRRAEKRKRRALRRGD